MLQLVMIPIAGAFIGWITNRLAIVMLFRPHRPIRIPLLGLEIQGLIPRRRRELARALARAVEDDLLSVDDILDRLATQERRDEVVASLLAAAGERIRDRVQAFIPERVVSLVLGFFSQYARREIRAYLDRSVDMLSERFREDLDLAGMVESKIAGLPLAEVERLVGRLAARELWYIEIFGAVLGFFIGVLQAAFLLFARR